MGELIIINAMPEITKVDLEAHKHERCVCWDEPVPDFCPRCQMTPYNRVEQLVDAGELDLSQLYK